MTSATDNRTTELLPCPFCGGEATVERIGRSGYYYVACNTAYCCDFGKFDTEAEAIAAWNTRADYHGYEQAAIEAWESIKAWNTRAELGSGTCKPKWTLQGKTQTQEFWRCECGNCGECFGVETRESFPLKMTIGKVEVPNFCPNCGRKVVSA